jgi:hypothetical protein
MDSGSAHGRTVPLGLDVLDHDQLAIVAREHHLAGHIIDRSGMPIVTAFGIDVMRDIAIEEWMGASPIYAKRMQRLLGFEGDTVEVALKGFQFDIGSPLEFMDFRLAVQDERHGTFQLNHCGALMDVEPLGEEFITTMCHHIEDPTFDATGWATNPRLRMRPVHRPPRIPLDRHPHCSWTVTIDPDSNETPAPERARQIGRSHAAHLPIRKIEGRLDDGYVDYRRPLDADLRHGDFASGALRAIIDEIDLQAHLLVISFAWAVSQRFDPETMRDIVARQFTGIAGWAAERLVSAFRLGNGIEDVATAFELHPAFHPRAYVDWHVEGDGDSVHLRLSDCPALEEKEHTCWVSTLHGGDLRPLQAIATAIDPYYTVRADGDDSWVVARGDTHNTEFDEVMITKFTTATSFTFER